MPFSDSTICGIPWHRFWSAPRRFACLSRGLKSWVQTQAQKAHQPRQNSAVSPSTTQIDADIPKGSRRQGVWLRQRQERMPMPLTAELHTPRNALEKETEGAPKLIAEEIRSARAPAAVFPRDVVSHAT